MANDRTLEALYVDNDDTAVHAVKPLAPAEESSRTAALICISGRSIGQMFLLTKNETSIGRACDCDVFLDDEGVSRQHAKVVRQGEDLVLKDLGSTNGTFHEGERIEALTLTDGAKIQVGTATLLQFRNQDQREVQFLSLMQSFKTHDSLTETYNKGAFLSVLEKEVGFARRHGLPLALIMFDLDHFKRVNDTFGHPAGDYVLRAVAKRVQEALRKEDVLARFGGEEFVVLLRNTNIERAFIVAERLRRAVEQLELRYHEQRISVTTSVGVAGLSDDVARPQALMEAADERLYLAKRRGRNRTETPLFD